MCSCSRVQQSCRTSSRNSDEHRRQRDSGDLSAEEDSFHVPGFSALHDSLRFDCSHGSAGCLSSQDYNCCGFQQTKEYSTAENQAEGRNINKTCGVLVVGAEEENKRKLVKRRQIIQKNKEEI